MSRRALVIISALAGLLLSGKVLAGTSTESVGETADRALISPLVETSLSVRGHKGSKALGDSIWGFPINESDSAVGVEFTQNNFFVTCGGTNPEVNAYDRNGNWRRRFPQFRSSGWGWRDLASDGLHLYGSDDNMVTEFGAYGADYGDFPGPLNPNRALAYDPETDHFWTASFTSPIYEFDRSGAVTNTYPNGYSIYGMAWDDASLDGPWLWVSAQTPDMVYQFNPVAGTYTGVSFPAASVPGGCCFTTEWDSTRAVLFYLAQSAPDYVIAYEIWVDTTPPAPPWALTANGSNPSPWTNDSVFSVDWTNPPDQTGIRGAWYKVGGPPTHPENGTYTIEKPFQVTDTVEGGRTLWVWLQDGAGNKSHLNNATVQLRLDMTPPTNPDSCTELGGAPSGVWQNGVSNPNFTWSGAGDTHSGVKGYYYYWGSDPGGTSGSFTPDTAYDPPVVSSGVYYLRVDTEDNAGNRAGWVTLFVFKYDGIAPTNPTSCTELGGAESGMWQNQVSDPNFTWSGAADQHSGVRGYYYYWGQDSTGTSGNFTPSEGHDPSSVTSGVYYLRVDTEDSAGNRAGWIGLFELRYDGIPPTGSVAYSPDSSLTLDFQVSWSAGVDSGGSGLVGRYNVQYKDGAGGWIEDWLMNTPESTAVFTGYQGHTYYFEAAAWDSAGNVEGFSGVAECSTYVDTTIGLDIEPPSISHSPVGEGDAGSPVDIGATITDNDTVEAATLSYRAGGSTAFVSVSMSNPSGDTWGGVIPGDSVVARGVEYYIQATDGRNQATHGSPESPHRVTVNAILGTSCYAEVYRLISLPLSPSNARPISVLGDDLGEYNREVWRLFRWDGSSYDEHPDVEDMTPGRGFWLITRDSKSIDASGKTAWAEDSLYYSIALRAGWNQIGNPFSFEVDWGACLAESSGVRRPVSDPSQVWVEDRLVDYYDGGYHNVDELEPWRGYWVKNVSGAAVYLLVPQKEAGSSMTNCQIPMTNVPNGVRGKEPYARCQMPAFAPSSGRGEARCPGWVMRIGARCGGASDDENSMGVSTEARDGWDRLDFSEPPVIGDWVSLYFPHYDWQKNPGRYTTDMRAEYQISDTRYQMPDVKQEGTVWRFVVETNLRNELVVLSWEAVEGKPEDAYLTDLSTDVTVDIAETGKYTFPTRGSFTSREFELRPGRFTPRLSGRLSIPRFLSYPNPAVGSFLSVRVECETDVSLGVKVFNAAGALVREAGPSEVVKQGYNRDGTALVYEWVWDLTDREGKPASSGVYFYLVRAAKGQDSVERRGKAVVVR